MISRDDSQVLADLQTVLNSLDLPMLLVGAGARLLIFDAKFGQGRSTTDWDIAVRLDSWETYATLRAALTEGDSPLFGTTKSAHKFKHLSTNIEVDIVPFGNIGEPDQEIIWPDSGNPMNIAGFAEALDHAQVETIGGLTLSIVSTPAFVALKILAWGDRRERTGKDLDDLEFILTRYEDDERIYTVLADELADGTIEFLDAPAYLLGQDIRKIFQPETLANLDELLKLILHDSGENDDAQESTLLIRLKLLQKGMRP